MIRLCNLFQQYYSIPKFFTRSTDCEFINTNQKFSRKSKQTILFIKKISESTATERQRDTSPKEVKENSFIQNPHQNEPEDAKTFQKRKIRREKKQQIRERNLHQ